MPKTDQPDKDHPVVYLPPTDSLDKAKLLFDSDAITVQGNNETFKRLTGEFGPSEGDTEGFTFFVKPEAGQRIIATTELWSQDDLEKGLKMRAGVTTAMIEHAERWTLRSSHRSKASVTLM